MLPRSESFRGNRSVACQDSGSASQPPTRPPSPYCCSSRRKPNTLCSGREPRACKCKCIFHSAAMCLVNPQHAKQDTRTGRLSNIKSSTAMFPDRPGQRLQSTPAPPSLHQEIDGIGTQSHVLRRLVPPIPRALTILFSQTLSCLLCRSADSRLWSLLLYPVLSPLLLLPSVLESCFRACPEFRAAPRSRQSVVSIPLPL